MIFTGLTDSDRIEFPAYGEIQIMTDVIILHWGHALLSIYKLYSLETKNVYSYVKLYKEDNESGLKSLRVSVRV